MAMLALLLGLQLVAARAALPAIAPGVTPVPTRTFDIEVRVGDAPLWRGALRVGASGASYEMSSMEAPAEGCDAEQDRFQGNHQSLHLSVSRGYGVNSASQINVSASWEHPADASCAGAAGSRTVSVEQAVTIAGTTPVVLTGDGGLSIRLVAR